MSASRAWQAVSSATWLSAAGYLSFALNFGLNLWLVLLLFPADFGTFVFVVSLVELASVAMGLIFSKAMIQMPQEPVVEETAYRLTLRVAVVIGVVGPGGALGLARIQSALVAAVFFVVLVMRLLGVVSSVYAARLEREFRYRSISLARLTGVCFVAAAAVAGFPGLPCGMACQRARAGRRAVGCHPRDLGVSSRAGVT